jgi:two-component system chemotaxis response regulator CheY
MSKTILIVDDDKLIRESLGAMLRGAGHEVIDAENGEVGASLALERHPDLVITDVRMPVKDGLAMVDDIRSDEWGKKLPVIILTNDEATETLNHALQDGVTIYLSKVNLDPEELSQQVMTALG